jgi:hypothetical protein
MTYTPKNRFRWYAQDANGEFYLTLGGKRFGRDTYATEAQAREAAILWDQSDRAADEDEIKWGVQ